MPVKSMSLALLVFGASGLLVACAGTATPAQLPTAVEPPTAAIAAVAPTIAPATEIAAATMWCRWAGLGATITAGDKRLNFSCDTGDPANAVGLFGEIESTDEGWMIAEAPVTATEAGPVGGEIAMVTVDYIELADGTKCANAGHGATLGYDDKRLNYTCEVTSGEQVGLFGDVAVTDEGWQITKAAFSVSEGGPTVTTPTTETIAALGVPSPSAAP